MPTKYVVWENGCNAAGANLLSILRSNPEHNSIRNYIDDFIRSQTGPLWLVNVLRADTNASLGEYGYIEQDGTGEHFVHLGHLEDLIEVDTSSAVTFYRDRRQNQEQRRIHEWPNGIFR